MTPLIIVVAAALSFPTAVIAEELPIFDAHVHYSHDAREALPTHEAIAILRRAGVRRALVSSSDDEGTQRLLNAAPDLIIPELRPYRTRSDVGAWVHENDIIRYLEERLAKYQYVAIGEFHLYGADADLPVPRRMVELAKKYGLMLHAHSDVDAIERLFKQDPNARILWAHSGFTDPVHVREMLRKHKNLWADLAFRTDHAPGGKLAPEWREAFLEFPDRFMVGSDTYIAERWHFVPEHATTARRWLSELPRDVAERIGWKNGEDVLGGAFAKRRSE
ncbi:MAG: amidohydrolase family protein [Burkholderiales bacterium]